MGSAFSKRSKIQTIGELASEPLILKSHRRISNTISPERANTPAKTYTSDVEVENLEHETLDDGHPIQNRNFKHGRKIAKHLKPKISPTLPNTEAPATCAPRQQLNRNTSASQTNLSWFDTVDRGTQTYDKVLDAEYTGGRDSGIPPSLPSARSSSRQSMSSGFTSTSISGSDFLVDDNSEQGVTIFNHVIHVTQIGSGNKVVYPGSPFNSEEY